MSPIALGRNCSPVARPPSAGRGRFTASPAQWSLIGEGTRHDFAKSRERTYLEMLWTKVSPATRMRRMDLGDGQCQLRPEAGNGPTTKPGGTQAPHARARAG